MLACQEGFRGKWIRGGIYRIELLYIPPKWGYFMEVLQAALRYTARGVAAIPVWRDKNKNPYLSTYSEFYMRLPTWEQWRRWANRWPSCNVALITGYWGLVALDFDTEESYFVWCDGPGRGIRGQTWTTRTSRGYHVWFQMEADPGESRSYTYQGHEVLLRAKGGYCIVPPSVHHSGAHYRTVHRVEPWVTEDIEFYLQGWEPKQAKTTNLGPVHSLARENITRIEELIPIPEGANPNGRGAYKVRCPFHDDDSPSAWVNVEQQRFGCNACWPGKWLDVINIIALKEGISNKEAYLKVQQAIG